VLEPFGAAPVADTTDPSALYRAEHTFLQSNVLIPLLYLPKAYGVSGRVHDLSLAHDGTPLYAGASLEDGR
jgi:hypothetical protein